MMMGGYGGVRVHTGPLAEQRNAAAAPLILLNTANPSFTLLLCCSYPDFLMSIYSRIKCSDLQSQLPNDFLSFFLSFFFLRENPKGWKTAEIHGYIFGFHPPPPRFLLYSV